MKKGNQLQNSEETKILLKVRNSRELNNTIIDSTEGVNYHLFGVYINHNYRSYLKFYELDTGKKAIDFDTDCPNCIGKNYYMTHNLYYILK